MAEMERVLGKQGLRQTVSKAWTEMAPKVLKQAKLEMKRNAVNVALHACANEGNVRHIKVWWNGHFLRETCLCPKVKEIMRKGTFLA